MPCRTVPYQTRIVTTNDFAPVLVHLQKSHHNLFFMAVPSCTSDLLCPRKPPACPPCPKLFSWLSTCTPAPALEAPRHLLPAFHLLLLFSCLSPAYFLLSPAYFPPTQKKSFLLTFSQWKGFSASPPPAVGHQSQSQLGLPRVTKRTTSSQKLCWDLSEIPIHGDRFLQMVSLSTDCHFLIERKPTLVKNNLDTAAPRTAWAKFISPHCTHQTARH